MSRIQIDIACCGHTVRSIGVMRLSTAAFVGKDTYMVASFNEGHLLRDKPWDQPDLEVMEVMAEAGSSGAIRRRWELDCATCGKHVVLRGQKMHPVLINAAKLFDKTGLHEVTRLQLSDIEASLAS